jgi:AraC-like DNA-binding protein
MLRNTLQQTRCVSLTRFEHAPGDVLTDSQEPAADRFQINIVEQGWFRLGHGRREWTLGPDSFFLSRPNDLYSYSHMRHLQPDTCLTLEFSVTTDELVNILKRLPLVLPRTNRLRFLQLQLSSVVPDETPIALDSVACELVDATSNIHNDRHHLYGAEQLKWYARRIAVARELMDSDPTRDHSLYNLASQVAMSPFLFARVFRELIGLPPHKYLVQLRLQRARTLLQSGMSVTETCYASGFNNLSHFIRTFRKHFGYVPSGARSFVAP